MGDSKIFIQIWSSSFTKESVFHVKSRFPSTLSYRDCADVCYKAFRGILTFREGRVCICVFKRSLEKYESKISIQTSFSSHKPFFSKLKQFVRTCSPIVRT